MGSFTRLQGCILILICQRCTCLVHKQAPYLPFLSRIVDLTTTLSAIHGLPDGSCIFNPSILQLSHNVFLISTRIYKAKDTQMLCRNVSMRTPPFLDGWRGTCSNLLAVLDMNLTSRPITMSVTGHLYVKDYNLEDIRLFKDQDSNVLAYANLLAGSGHDRGTINVILPVNVVCSNNCHIHLGLPRPLLYSGAAVKDKNWVPWDGTSSMSYSRLALFGPQSILDWKSLSRPRLIANVSVALDDAFFNNISYFYRHLVQLAGGTPAVLMNESYIGIGHVKVHPGCLHAEAAYGLQLRENCQHLIDADFPPVPKEAFKYGLNMSGVHYPYDYGFFAYKFTNRHPYRISHISPCFIPTMPYDHLQHSGVVFPLGLFLTQRQVFISYGDQDQASKMLVLSRNALSEMLRPVEYMHQAERFFCYNLQSMTP